MMMGETELMAASATLGISTSLFLLIVAVISLWGIFWKGWALWLAARQSHKKWFVAILLLNTLGILEIIYIFTIGKKGQSKGTLT